MPDRVPCRFTKSAAQRPPEKRYCRNCSFWKIETGVFKGDIRTNYFDRSGTAVVHSCSENCTRRLCWESATPFIEARGTLNPLPQAVHVAMTGTRPSHFTTLRLRFSISLSS